MNETVLEAINNVAKTEGFASFEIQEGETNKKGEGFTAKIFKVTVKNKNSNRILHLIVKQALEAKKTREYFPIRDSFLSEIHFYTQIYPALADLGETAQLIRIPKCYSSSTGQGREFLILENLCASGFNTIERARNLDGEILEIVFRNYGVFHALTFALKQKQPEVYSKVTEHMIDLLKRMFTQFGADKSIRNLEEASAGLILDSDKKILKRLKDFKNKLKDRVTNCLETSGDYKTVLHGDCWSNNLLFKINEGKFENVALVDWQLTRVGNPICDLSYMFYSGASKREFEKLDHFLQIYYESFATTLKNLRLTAEEVWPFEQLRKDWAVYAIFGVCMAIDVIKLKYTNPGKAKDLKDWSEVNWENEEETKEALDYYDREIYLQKTADLFRHLYEINFL